MKMFLISDNTDTQMGMRLSGIDGVVVHEHNEFKTAMEKTLNDPEIGIVLVTEKLVQLAGDYILDIKRDNNLPLIVEIPDRHARGRHKSIISSYISEALGVRNC